MNLLLATLVATAAVAAIVVRQQHQRPPFRAKALQPFGAIVEGVSVPALLRSGAALRQLWRDHGGLLVIRGLSLAPSELLSLSELFGDVESELDDSKQAYRVGGHNSVMRIGNIRDESSGALISMHTISAALPADGSAQYRPAERLPVWHTDSVYRAKPPIGSVLYCHIAPPSGAATCFASTAAAFDALDDATKARLRTLEVVCSLTHHDAKVQMRGSPDYPTLTAAQRAANPPQRAPLVLTHPRTGREAVYGVNSGTFAVVPKGTPLSQAELDACELEAREMPSVEKELRSLLPHMTEARFVVPWQWRHGDLVVWDNRATVHCATGFDHERHAREMWRTTIVSDRD